MKFKKIEIDIDVNKLIESHRISFEETQNEILKRILKNKNTTEDVFMPIGVENRIMNISNNGLFWKDTLLKNGLLLRKKFKGKLHYAKIENNQIVINNKSFHSPSAAAVELTNTSQNGWIFWEYFDEEKNTWEILDNLRKK